MLSKENVELGSTCNTIGQNLGYFISFVGFLAFNNPEVCNSYFRPLLGKDADAEVGMVSLGDFFTFFGIAMAVTTCLVALFKKERATASDEVENMTNAYGSMYTAAKQPMVQKLFLVLLTYRVGFAVADNVTHLKMIEYGFKKERIAMVTPLLLPLSLITPVLAKRSGAASLTVWLSSYKWRLLIGAIDAGIVYYIGIDMDTAFYMFVALSIVWTTVSSIMFTAQMEFFAKAAAENPTIGGTYMTLLNTVANLGGSWPQPVALWCVGKFTTLACANEDAKTGCTGMDGFYPVAFIFTLLGGLWIAFMASTVRELRDAPASSWRLKQLKSTAEKSQ